MRYGLPWQGTKSRIAEWVVGLLPPSHTFVDLFAGGCAVTHCAILSGKWSKYIANDITDSVSVFLDAIRGEYHDFSFVPTKDEFNESDDTMVRLLYSFGNDRTTYLWASDIAKVKVPACKMLTAPSLHERRTYYREFCHELAKYVKKDGIDNVSKTSKSQPLQSIERVQGIERLESIERLERLEGFRGLEEIDGLQLDYRLVDIPDGSTVYADPPYRNTCNSVRYGKFDFDAFDQWLGGVDFPVFVSEFDAPAGCVELAHTERVTSMAAKSTSKRTERIFIQERFADRVQVGEPRLF